MKRTFQGLYRTDSGHLRFILSVTTRHSWRIHCLCCYKPNFRSLSLRSGMFITRTDARQPKWVITQPLQSDRSDRCNIGEEKTDFCKAEWVGITRWCRVRGKGRQRRAGVRRSEMSRSVLFENFWWRQSSPWYWATPRKHPDLYRKFLHP